MKTIIKTESIQDFKSYFDKLSTVTSAITLWQVNSSTNDREIVKVHYKKFDLDKDIIRFNCVASDVKFLESDIYFYCSELNFIFKSTKVSIENNEISINSPQEIKVLDEEEGSDLIASLSDDAPPAILSDDTVVQGVTEKFTNENFEHNSQREHINTEYDVHESVVDKIQNKDLSGKTEGAQKLNTSLVGEVAGTEKIAPDLSGHSSTDNLNTSMSGKSSSSSERLSTSMVGKGKTEHQTTRVNAKTKTDHSSTTVATKTKEEYEQSQRDKEIFETQLSFISLDEEDKKFAGQRDAPRARPEKGKMITMKVQGSDQEKESHELFDLSRGGLGVICFDEDRYAKDDIIEIFAFDKNILDSPMLSIIRSVREADETKTSFKIGMQFYNP
jgi:hypothetical protein